MVVTNLVQSEWIPGVGWESQNLEKALFRQTWTQEAVPLELPTAILLSHIAWERCLLERPMESGGLCAQLGVTWVCSAGAYGNITRTCDANQSEEAGFRIIQHLELSSWAECTLFLPTHHHLMERQWNHYICSSLAQYSKFLAHNVIAVAYWKVCLSSFELLSPFSKISSAYLCGTISGFCVHWFMYLCLCKYYTVLVTVDTH